MTQILVIEDEKRIRENVAEIMAYEGYQVLQAEHGVMGIQLAQDHIPDLIICDIMMPGLDGFEVLDEMQLQPTTATIPFIFLTAKSDRVSVRHGIESGADDYITKPFSSLEIVRAVQSQLKRQSLINHRSQQNIDELRGNLVSLLPHELRTPLIGILGYADLIQTGYETSERGDIRRMGEEIAESGQRLHRVIENYLLYAQTEILRHEPQAGEAILKQRTAIPGTLIRDVVAQKVYRFQRESDVTVQTEDVCIQISAERLSKIVEELVDNALKFSKNGTEINITAKSEGSLYILKVLDKGRGMTNDQISRIGAYMQFERKLYEQQGMGLGLILAKRFAELHGGKLTIISEPGRGTTVSVELLLAA